MSAPRNLAPPRSLLYGVLGAALFMLELAALDRLYRGWVSLPALVPPFGASVVIVFFTPESPAGRPWSVVVGHTVSALAAASVLALCPTADVGLQAAFSVSLAGSLMWLSRSFHPPGGATALLAVVLEQKLGFAMVLCPMLVGALALVGTRSALDRVWPQGAVLDAAHERTMFVLSDIWLRLGDRAPRLVALRAPRGRKPPAR